MTSKIQIIVLILLLVSFLINAIGPSRHVAHGGGYSRHIFVVNIVMAGITFAVLIYKLVNI
jgi:hypothetical protein